ncbi:MULTISPECIES: MFS transporter [Streptomyces]|uniref:MFS transporter n=1 Tax=Streptomyces TaxID=1883 RepID=UPI000CD5BC74|nr:MULTISPECIES: MFS transporter [unclassified Streptomyces]QXQ98059.1 MFS transporter [Streptomyces sp. WY228]
MTSDVLDPSPPTKKQRHRLGRDYGFQVSAYSVQTLGEGVIIATLPLLASKITEDPRLISWVSVAHELPWLLLALPCGVLVDRFDRRRLMLRTQAAQGGLLFCFAILASFGFVQLWMVYLLAFLLCTGDILFTGASRAMIPNLVPRSRLETANGRIVTAETIGKQFAGPPLGTALFAFALPLPLWFNAITYLASLLLLMRINGANGRFQPERPDLEKGRERPKLLAEATEGLRYVMRHRVLGVIVAMAAVSNFGALMALSIQVLFAQQVLGVGDMGYGLLLAAMATGGVAGALVSERIVRWLGARKVAVTVSLGSSLSLMAIGLIGRQPWVVVLLFCVWSAGLAVWNVMAASVSQRLTPDDLRGRVSAGSRMVCFGALPLGAFVGGFVAAEFGLAAPWIAGGAVHLAATILLTPAILRWSDEAVGALPEGETGEPEPTKHEAPEAGSGSGQP